MRTLRRTLLVFVAVTLMGTVLPPGILLAQTSGVGSDGLTRLGWIGTDGRVSLWRLDSLLNLQLFQEYGPFPGYLPIAITVGTTNNRTYVLWRHTSGSISLWWLGPNLTFGAFQEYGPFPGYTAESLSIDPTDNSLRVLWQHTTGLLSIWTVDANLAFVRFHEYGPFFGYDPAFMHDAGPAE
jgi:hypothetical protein